MQDMNTSQGGNATITVVHGGERFKTLAKNVACRTKGCATSTGADGASW